MTKKLFFSLLALLVGSFAISAQDKKVAVFDPAGEVQNSIKEIVREEISSVIVNTEGFTVLERQLINKVLEENKFQMGGLVDDSQISDIGKRMGANFVFVTSITPLGNNYYISCKMIEVMTARIEKQKTAQTSKGANDLIPVAQKLVADMFTQNQPAQTQIQKPEPVVDLPISVANMLVVDGSSVFQQGRKLDKNDVRNLMANTDAIRVYNKGLSQYKQGKGWIVGGICVLGLAAVGSAAYFTEILGSIEDSYAYGNTYADSDTGAIIAVVGGAIGLTFEITGIVLKSSGKSNIRQAVDMYNRKSNTSDVKLNFGFTSNGIGLTMMF